MITMDIDQAADRFTKLIRLIGEGEDVLVMDHDRPVARITRCEETPNGRPDVGTITSPPVRYSDDCFDPISDRELLNWGL
jgi:antitoxin (DNA-binding transcriptional repressor) of toxin-antitoxin stability system